MCKRQDFILSGQVENLSYDAKVGCTQRKSPFFPIVQSIAGAFFFERRSGQEVFDSRQLNE